MTSAADTRQTTVIMQTAITVPLLVLLRYIAVVAQASVIGIAHFALDVTLPLAHLALPLAALIVWNVVSTLRYRRHGTPANNTSVFLHFVVDVCAFTVVLYYTGGPANPFVSLYLLPIALAATSLPASYAWTLAGLCGLGYSVLWWAHVPLSLMSNHSEGSFDTHLAGMWVNFLIAAALIVFFVGRISRAVRNRDQELAALREASLRDQQVVALGALAAGTAHELNTPLATLTLLIDELHSDTKDNAERLVLREMMREIETISARLNDIASGVGAQRSAGAQQTTVRALLDDIISRWQSAHPAIELIQTFELTNADEPIVAEETVTQAIRNVLDNAAEASLANNSRMVEVTVASIGNKLDIRVRDHGAGLHSKIKTHVGKRVASTKPLGLGMGLLLSQTTLEQFGGNLVLDGQQDGGVEARISLPLDEFAING